MGLLGKLTFGIFDLRWLDLIVETRRDGSKYVHTVKNKRGKSLAYLNDPDVEHVLERHVERLQRYSGLDQDFKLEGDISFLDDEFDDSELPEYNYVKSELKIKEYRYFGRGRKKITTLFELPSIEGENEQ